ncbi:unnamed protein product [Chondrus crispus]|uniref:Uncharacterized protein n=1 Tax=Chondrus crispus TaxID=2769 RepID=R7Q461_CHOCR|nr:unnamed protein product [Chondrus crispus]CDF32658.1 unnamed protein product [Chondrus crispus]|eukprot:XP_005712429.1 unnamed protein product [Chondrus crispus]
MPQKRKRHLPLATAAPSPEEALHAPSAVNPAAPPSDVPDGIPVADDPVHNPLLCAYSIPS